MKNTQKTSYVLFAAVLFLFSGSCRHLKEELENFPLPSQRKISKIIYEVFPDAYIDSSYNRTTFFNTNGDPEKTIVKETSTGNSNQAYIYDNKGNLIQWISYFGDSPSSVNAVPQFNNIFVFHQYGHDINGNIIADTLYISNGMPVGGGATLYSVTSYEYDTFDRLVYSDEHHVGFNSDFHVEQHYSYGIDGNLAGYKYDDRPSFRRLSKAMMFLMKDYSVNNRLESVQPESESMENYLYEYGLNNYPVKVTGPKLLPDETGLHEGTSSIYYM